MTQAFIRNGGSMFVRLLQKVQRRSAVQVARICELLGQAWSSYDNTEIPTQGGFTLVSSTEQISQLVDRVLELPRSIVAVLHEGTHLNANRVCGVCLVAPATAMIDGHFGEFTLKGGMTIVPEQTYVLLALVVTKDFQSRGHGGQLLGDVLSTLISQGSDALIVPAHPMSERFHRFLENEGASKEELLCFGNRIYTTWEFPTVKASR